MDVDLKFSNISVFKRLGVKLKTISIMTVLNFNISSDSYQKKLFFYCHQRKESLFHKNPENVSVKNALNMQVRLENDTVDRGPRTEPCGLPRHLRRLRFHAGSAENSSFGRWARFPQPVCDEATFHSFLLEFNFLSLPLVLPSALHQSEETQSVVMSLRRSQPCDCAVAYSNWIRVEIILLPVRLLKSPSVSGFSATLAGRRRRPRCDRCQRRRHGIRDEVGAKNALNRILVQSYVSFRNWWLLLILE